MVSNLEIANYPFMPSGNIYRIIAGITKPSHHRQMIKNESRFKCVTVRKEWKVEIKMLILQ